MAITTSAPNGVIVTTAAVSEAAGSQTQAASNQVVLSNSFANLNNGNVAVGISYPTRLVMIRRGTATQEIKYCTAETAGTPTTFILTVHEDWDVPPATSDQIDISYVIQDAATLTGLGLINKRVADYTSSRRFTVGSGGGTFAFFAMIDGVSLESVDNGSTTVADFIVENGAYFVNGYVAANTPVSGGYIIGTPATNGELVFNAVSGSYCYLYDWFLTCVFQNKIWFRGTAVFNKAKIFSGSYTAEINGTITAFNITFEGKGATTDTWLVDASTDIDTMSLISTNGFITDADATVQSITLRNITFVGNLRHFLIYEKKTIELIDPSSFVPVITDQTELDFAGTIRDGLLNERYSLKPTVQQADGTAIPSSLVAVYEGLLNDNLELVVFADSNGQVDDSWIYKTYSDNADTSVTVTEYGNHALRVYKYGYVPFIAAQTSNVKFSGAITLIDDSAITEASQATALTTGSGITPIHHAPGETDTRPMKVLNYDAGTGSVPTVGETITQGSATGVVVEYLGSAASGTLVLDNWNGTEFTDNQTMSGGASTFNGVTDLIGGTSFYQEYSWEIDCTTKSLVVTYDYLAAEMAGLGSPIISAIYEQLHEWGGSDQSQAIYSGAAGYFTLRALQEFGSPDSYEGVWLSNRGGGTIAYMTSDANVQYTPAVTYTHTLNNIQENTEITYVTFGSPRTELFHVEDVDGTGITEFTYSGLVAGTEVDILVHHINYQPDVSCIYNFTLPASNASAQIQQFVDDNYFNPLP